VAGDTLILFAISTTLILPSLNNVFATSISSFLSNDGLPGNFPLAFAAASPAIVLSLIIDLSNSAKDPNI